MVKKLAYGITQLCTVRMLFCTKTTVPLWFFKVFGSIQLCSINKQQNYDIDPTFYSGNCITECINFIAICNFDHFEHCSFLGPKCCRVHITPVTILLNWIGHLWKVTHSTTFYNVCSLKLKFDGRKYSQHKIILCLTWIAK